MRLPDPDKTPIQKWDLQVLLHALRHLVIQTERFPNDLVSELFDLRNNYHHHNYEAFNGVKEIETLRKLLTFCSMANKIPELQHKLEGNLLYYICLFS